jgi:O-methyltransferase
MKSLLRFAATCISEKTYERLLAHAVLKERFLPDLAGVPQFRKREDLWDFSLKNYSPSKLVFVEFGVHTGYSIKYFAQKNTDPNSVFIGLDSFEGLPEDWGKDFKKGSFDVLGSIPQIDDARIKFIEGWFQNTSNDLFKAIPGSGVLIVHYDADLYSSTLFALTKLDSLKRPYLAIFDEFAGHEARALRNYQQSYAPNLKFLGKTVAEGYPNRVLCKIEPTGG